MKTIDLEELFEKKGIKNSTSHHNYEYLYKTILEVTKEACRQTLEIAADNATVVIETCMGQKTGDVWVDKESILDTINQIK